MLLRSWNEGTHRPFFPLCFRNAKGIGGECGLWDTLPCFSTNQEVYMVGPVSLRRLAWPLLDDMHKSC